MWLTEPYFNRGLKITAFNFLILDNDLCDNSTMGIDCLGRTKKTNIYFIIFILSNLLIGMGSRYDINYINSRFQNMIVTIYIGT